MERGHRLGPRMRPRRPHRHQLEAVRAERPVLPRSAEGRFDPSSRPAAVPSRAARSPARRGHPHMHLPEHRRTVVSRRPLRVPRPGAGSLPALQLQRTILPVGCRRFLSGPWPAASDAGPGGRGCPVPGPAGAALAAGRAWPGLPAPGRPGVSSASSATPPPAAAQSAAAPGRGAETGSSSRTRRELAAARDLGSRPPRISQWRHGCRCSPA
jgi:hypothetical protein